MKMLHVVAFLLVAVGGLNWGLYGLGMLMGGSSWNLVNRLLGFSPMLENLVYVLVGLSTVWLVVNHRTDCRTCSEK